MRNKEKEEFANWIREFRFRMRDRMEYLEMNATDLSKRSGVSKQSIGKYLSGENVPNAVHAVKLARALIWSTDQLINF